MSKKLPFSDSVIEELMNNSGMTLYELEQDYAAYKEFMIKPGMTLCELDREYTNYINEPEHHDGEFSEDWTKEQ